MKYLTGLVFLLGAGAALAAAPPPATPPSGEVKEKLICKSIVKPGSRLARERRCLTAAQWVEQRKTARDAIEDARAR